MFLIYKLLFFFCLLGVAISVPIISAGISFGSPLYRPIGTPVYYERPHYYDEYYYDAPSRYSYDYAPNYEYVSGGIGGFHGSIGYSPYIF